MYVLAYFALPYPYVEAVMSKQKDKYDFILNNKTFNDFLYSSVNVKCL